MSDPRLLVIMGSGETAPTMAKVHRTLFDRLEPGPIPAVILDTPYGFQENADQLSARTVQFFEESVGRAVGVASYRSRDVDAVTAATAVSDLRGARFIMAGPGSPSYALRQWTDGPIPSALSERLRTGGVVTMVSAAALTIGVATIPIYEIYKVGEAPHWLPGLDLLGSATGLRAAVVPHFDNAEGGNHDTRFCYMGERRLQDLERQLPDGTFVLGVDSHTALLLDLGAGSASVAGRGGVTVRVRGASAVFPSGSEFAIDRLAQVAAQLAKEGAVDIGQEPAHAATRPEGGARSNAGQPTGSAGTGPVRAAGKVEPIRDTVADLEGAFVDALERNDRRGAVAALLDLDLAIESRTRSGEDSPDLDDAKSTFHALIARLGSAPAARDPEADTRLNLLVDELLVARTAARASGDWATADMLRSALGAAGVEIRDEVAGSTRV